MPVYTCFGCKKTFDHKGTYDRHISRKLSCNPTEKNAEIKELVKSEVKKEVKKIIKQAVREEENDTEEPTTPVNIEESSDTVEPTTVVKTEEPIKRPKKSKKNKSKSKTAEDILTVTEDTSNIAEDNIAEVNVVDNVKVTKPTRQIKSAKIAKVDKLLKRLAAEKQENSTEKEVDSTIEDTTESIIEDTLDTESTFSNLSLGVEIATREDLKEKIHSIHNFLRNNGVGYGMNALKVFNLFYGLARIEEKNLFKLVELDPSCKFSTLLEHANGNLDYLSEAIHEFQQKLAVSKVKRVVLFAIPRNISKSTLAHLIKEVDYLLKAEKTLNMQLAGKLYEYFVGRDKSAISEMGAYFTDRHIINYIYNNIAEIKLSDDNKVPTMIDPFGGSGGFTIGYITHLIEKYPNIDWSQNLDSIYHVDMNDDVVKYAGLEFMCLTQTPPNMDVNIRCMNTFKAEFDKKYKLIITNPPYGGDKNNKSAAYHAREKIRQYLLKQLETLDNDDLIEQKKKQLSYLKQLDKLEIQKFQDTKVSINTSSSLVKEYAKTHNLVGNDKESVSFILMMCLLDTDGTAIGVLKEGVFFDKKYTALRKHLVENFNVISITSVDQHQFENTSTKTSIIRFDNNGKTKQIKFYTLVVNKHEVDVFEEEKNGNVYISAAAGEISGLTNVLKSCATLQQIEDHKEKKYSLSAKNYNLDDYKDIKAPTGYKLVKLGGICEFLPKSNRSASFAKESGAYPFYTSSSVVKYCDVADYKETCIIIGDGGEFNIKMSNEFSCSSHNHIFKSTPSIMIYIYNYLKRSSDSIDKLYTGSVIRNISVNQLKQLEIPIPDNETKLNEIVKRISEPYNAKIQAETELSNLTQSVKDNIKNILENEECDEIKLGDICEIKTGKNKTPDNKNGKLYPYYGTAGITGYTDHYLYDGQYILIARNGAIGNCFITNGKFYPSDHIFIIKPLHATTNINILHQNILININHFINKSSGSIIAGIPKSAVETLIVKIPKNKEILDELQIKFNQIEHLQQLIQDSCNRYEQVISEVF